MTALLTALSQHVQDRDPTHNAACLTKFTELLLLNGIISTQQMWTVFNLVGDLFEGAGEGILHSL